MDELLLLMCAIVFLDYNVEHLAATDIVNAISNSAMYPDKWKTLAYFSSENRNFLAGSPEFLASVFVEAAEKLNRIDTNP